MSPQLLLIAPANAQALGLDTGEERNPWVERAKGEAPASQVRSQMLMTRQIMPICQYSSQAHHESRTRGKTYPEWESWKSQRAQELGKPRAGQSSIATEHLIRLGRDVSEASVFGDTDMIGKAKRHETIKVLPYSSTLYKAYDICIYIINALQQLESTKASPCCAHQLNEGNVHPHVKRIPPISFYLGRKPLRTRVACYRSNLILCGRMTKPNSALLAG